VATRFDSLVQGVVRVSWTSFSDTLDDTDDTSDDASDFLVRVFDGRLLGDRQYNLVWGNRKEWFHWMRFLNLRRLGDVRQHLGRGNRCV